jgi:DNA-directed DNA polymerase
MIQAFRENKDIHRTTASTIFNIPLEEVTDTYRRYAKAVNFGIIYGISDFGLSENVGITVKEAKKYIEDYLKKYPKIKEYMDNTKNIAVEKGYVETKFGRRRYVPNIKSQNYIIREQAKRIAMNAPIQGTAADITKIAMVKIEERIKKEKLDAKILLQVHDEIIVECNNNIKDKIADILKEEMEKAATLQVPIIADIRISEVMDK